MSSRIPVIIAGAGGHALVVWDLLECMGNVEVLGFTDPFISPGTTKSLGSLSRPVLGDDRVVSEYLLSHPDLRIIAGIGPDPYHVRQTVVAKIESLGKERTLTVVHPRSIVAASVQLGRGTVVMAGAIINPEAVIGNHCVINTGATVDHECRLGDNVFVQPGAHLGGKVIVEEGAVVGIGANIREETRIGPNACVGGGAFVNRDVPGNAVVVGVPAVFLRHRFVECVEDSRVRKGNRPS